MLHLCFDTGLSDTRVTGTLLSIGSQVCTERRQEGRERLLGRCEQQVSDQRRVGASLKGEALCFHGRSRLQVYLESDRSSRTAPRSVPAAPPLYVLRPELPASCCDSLRPLCTEVLTKSARAENNYLGHTFILQQL